MTTASTELDMASVERAARSGQTGRIQDQRRRP